VEGIAASQPEVAVLVLGADVEGGWHPCTASSLVIALLQLCCSSVAALLQLCCSSGWHPYTAGSVVTGSSSVAYRGRPGYQHLLLLLLLLGLVVGGTAIYCPTSCNRAATELQQSCNAMYSDTIHSRHQHRGLVSSIEV
jgi:hypothetical protein